MSESKARILVAIDEGPESDHAFDAAIGLAKRLGAALDVVHVIPPPSPADVAAEPPYVTVAREKLARAVDLARVAGLEATPILRQDTVVFSLLEAIDALQPVMVVVGTHGRSGVRRALLGSVSESLTRRSPVPVLVVPSPRRNELVQKTAWSCGDCGHILADNEGSAACNQCGATPARWLSAPIEAGPVDIAEPSVGEAVAGDLTQSQTRSSSSAFATSPPGCEGYDVNPELRIRY